MAHAARLLGLARPARSWALGAFACALLAHGPAPAATLDAGAGHNLAVTPAGEVWAWGMNERGQLGNATTFASAMPVRAGSLTGITAVSAGEAHSVALRSDLTVWTWGAGEALGVAAPQTCTLPFSQVACSRSPVQVAGLTGVTAIAAGGSHVLALRSNGTVAAWGVNSSGQIGDGTTTTRVTPVNVPGLTGVVAIAAGSKFSLALKSDGTVWTWGDGNHGELGYVGPQACPGVDLYTLASGPLCSLSPQQVPGLTGVTAISARGRHVLVLKSDQSVWTWGSGRYGQLGDGTTNDRPAPAQVPGMSPAARIEAGFSQSFVVKTDGTFWAFGLNHKDQLGFTGSGVTCPPGVNTYCVKSPVAVPQFDGAVSIVGGVAHALVVRANGAIVAFGINTSGQLGTGAGPFYITQLSYGDPHWNGPAGTSSSTGSLGTASTSGGLNLAALDDGLRFASTGQGVSSSPAEVRFTNLQETDIGVLAVNVTGDFSQTNDCPAILSAASGCSIFVTFTPTGPGERVGTLTVTTDVPEAASVSLELSGTTPTVMHDLAITRSGTGSGTVTSSPAGIDCGTTCVLGFVSGTTVSLSVAPAGGSTFAGWDGDCSGTGACSVGMTAARSVTAVFNTTPTGNGPRANPVAVFFGAQLANTTSAPRAVVVSNPGPSAFTISSVTATTSYVATHDCAGLVALATCTVNVTFNPASLEGQVDGTLTVVSNLGTLTVPLSGAGSNPVRLGNISTRMQVLTGNDVMIGGFVIGGSTAKKVAIVATGPSLTAFGITNPLPNPTLRLVRSSDQAVLATNDNWQSAANSAQLTAAGFAPSNALEAAILIDLSPGAYTAIVEGAGGATGVSVIGVYEVDHQETPLINISTRGRVLTGNDVMIGGFIINGTAPQTVAIVATGPSLTAFGITNPLADPMISLVRSSDQAVIGTNDNWQAAGNSSQLQAAGFAPSNPLEAALHVTLPPGAYTAIVQGVGGGTGVAVIGVYKVN